MPITTAVPVKVFDQEAFHAVDTRVTGFAFDIHNQFGRYLDEGLYQNELARRCEAAGFDVVQELQITVSLDDFEKPYFADILIDGGVIAETKTVKTLTTNHKGQTLNYLFLCGLHHATLLNFRPERVEREFVSTRLTHALRQRYEVLIDRFKPLTAACDRMRQILLRCLKEWGAYLDPILYRDAITHFLGGADHVARQVPVRSGDTTIGTQEMRLLADEIAFSVTASIHHPEAVHEHQRRFLRHTPLRALHWINLNHKTIDLRTIEKP